MSEMTAMRMGRAATLAAAAVAWCVGAWLLSRTSVPSLRLSGLDARRYFSAHQLTRTRDFSRGEQALCVLNLVAQVAALIVLVRLLPRSVRSMGLGRIASGIVAGMVLLVTLWFVGLPFSLAGLWWEHHWGLGPFDVLDWLTAQWSTLGPEGIFAMATIVLLVGTAGRF